MKITFKQKGDYSKATKYLKRIRNFTDNIDFHKYGRAGVEALSEATPVDTGLTASSWYYKITKTDKAVTIAFCNSNRQNGVPIAIVLQYGHATRNGGWVEGRDYINPAIRSTFDDITNKAWEEVKRK